MRIFGRNLKLILLCFVLLIFILPVSACSQKNKTDNQSYSSKPEYNSKTEERNIENNEHNEEITDFGYGELGYNDVLSKFRQTIIIRVSDNFEYDYLDGKVSLYIPTEYIPAEDNRLGYEWGCMLIEAPKGIESPNVESFGYVLKDLNADGVEELILMRRDHYVLAIFTSYNEKAVLLGAYWPRNTAVINEQDNIYVRKSGGAEYVTFSVCEVIKNDFKLRKIEEFGVEGENYFHTLNGERKTISEPEFERLLSERPYENSSFWKNVPINYFAK